MKTITSLLFSLGALAATASAGDMWVTIDHPRDYTSEQMIGSLVVGNPAIADVAVKSNQQLLIYGRMPGSTLVTLYSPQGDTIDTLRISVRNSSANRVTLQQGDTRISFNCTDVCEQVPAIGDGSNMSRLSRGPVTSQASQALGAAQNAAKQQMNPNSADPMFEEQPRDNAEDSENGDEMAERPAS